MASFDHVVKKLSEMSIEEFRESLIRAGIITKKGNLRTKYKQPKKLSPQKRALKWTSWSP